MPFDYGYKYDESVLPVKPEWNSLDRNELQDLAADPADIDEFEWTPIPDLDTTWYGEYDDWNKFVTMVLGLPFVFLGLIVLPIGWILWATVKLVLGDIEGMIEILQIMVNNIKINIYQIFYVPYIIGKEISLFLIDVITYVGRIVWWVISKFMVYLIWNYLSYIFFWARDALILSFRLTMLAYYSFINFMIEFKEQIIYYSILLYYTMINTIKFLYWLQFRIIRSISKTVHLLWKVVIINRDWIYFTTIDTCIYLYWVVFKLMEVLR